MQSFALKVILVGDSNVGKSQLSRSFMKKDFLEKSQSTVGIEFATREIDFEKCIIKSQVWDTAGQERFAKMTKAYYKNAVGAMLVYDICKASSFERLKTVWLTEVQNYSASNIRLMLVGNKTDLVNSGSCSREVSISEGMAFAKEHGIDFFETSALSGHHVEVCFRRIFLSIARKLPDIEMQLELSFLPEGWMVCTRPLTKEEEDELSDRKQRSATIACAPGNSDCERQTSVGVPSSITASIATVGPRTTTIGSSSEASVATTRLYNDTTLLNTMKNGSNDSNDMEMTDEKGSAEGTGSYTADVDKSNERRNEELQSTPTRTGKFDKANFVTLKTVNSNEDKETARLTMLERVESDRWYINYWTGELIHTLPQSPAIVPGLLYDAENIDKSTIRSCISRENSPQEGFFVKENSKDQIDVETPTTERASGSSSGKTVNLHQADRASATKKPFKCFSCTVC